MPESLTLHPYWIAIPAALLPGILGWWWSRTLPADAAVLAEWQMALGRKIAFTVTPCTMVIVALTGWSAFWLVPVQLLGLSYSRHRVRHALLGETWPLHHYLVWQVRGFVGVFGFWAFIAMAPTVVVYASRGAVWWVAGACTALAIGWLHFNWQVLLWAVKATPLQRPDLEGPFQQVFDRASSARPTLWRAGARGGVIANALALPSIDRGSVLFLDTLLERLTIDEITAILAHEVAHLEHYTRSRLVRSYVAAWVVILIIIPGSALVMMTTGYTWPAGVAPGLVLCALWARASRMQAHETESDLRAVELCGNPEALVSALSRIYAINHVPRRVSLHHEQRATHPSLARRIRDIRDRARGVTAPRLTERVVLWSTEAGRFAILDVDHVSFGWTDEATRAGSDADLASRATRIETISYKELGELRLAATKSSVALTAVDHQARQWTLPLRPADTAAAQSALDVVDQLLAHVPVRSALDWDYRLTAFLSLMCAWTASVSLSIIVPAFLTLVRPARRTMAGMAATLAGGAILCFSGLLQDPLQGSILVILAATGLWQLRRPPTEQRQNRGWTWLERAALVVPILIGLGMTVANGLDAFRVHVTLRDHPWIAVSVLTCTGYLAASPGRLSRVIAAAVGAIAAVAVWASSPGFLIQVAADPLVVEMPNLQERRIPLSAISENAVEGEFSNVSLTSDARHFLLSDDGDTEDADEGDATPRRYVVGGFDGWSRQFRALDAAFVHGDQLLTLDHVRDASELRSQTLRNGDTRWTLTIPDFTAISLSAAENGRWRAVGRQRNQLTRIDGVIGSSETVRTDWTIDAGDDEGYPVDDRVDDGNVGISMAYRWSEPLLPWASSRWQGETSLLRLDGHRTTAVATTRLMLDCLNPSVGVTGFICIGFDGERSRVWRYDSQASRLSPVGQVRGFIWAGAHGEHDRVSGMIRGREMRLLLDKGIIESLTLDADDCVVIDHAIAGDVVASICTPDGKTVVRLHRLGEATETIAP